MKKRFGKTIKDLRKKENLTIAELSKKSNVSVVTICKIENNKGNPSLLVLGKLSKALNVDFRELYKDFCE